MTPRLPELAAALKAVLAELDHAAVRARQARGDLEQSAAADNGEAVRIAHRLAGVEGDLRAMAADVGVHLAFVRGCLPAGGE